MTRLTYVVAGAAFLALIAAPADAKKKHHRFGHHGYGQYYGDNSHQYRRYYAPRAANIYYGGSYGYPYYRRSYSYYPRSPDYYGYYPRYSRYYGGYYPRYRRYRYRDCHDGAAGALIGGVAGALIGREIDRSGGRYYRHRRDGTTGLIIGGALGAVVGNQIARDC